MPLHEKFIPFLNLNLILILPLFISFRVTLARTREDMGKLNDLWIQDSERHD